MARSRVHIVRSGESSTHTRPEACSRLKGAETTGLGQSVIGAMTVTLPAGAYRDHEVETPSRYLSSEEAEVMKRESALIPLSQDHHVALFVAQRLRRAAPATINEARAAFLTYWNEHGRDHFSLEEELLLPAYAEYGDPHHRVVARVLCDHVDSATARSSSALISPRRSGPCTSSAPGFQITSGSRSASFSR
jgi:hypothetical protein